ncbi:GPI transamidase component PIG-S [Psilocybe cubensis]|uniref:GPI transamidase component PIG-S n=2 Tax=Psilocybe cubensis TaxID=181762 RepID=A0ACB8GTB9_PSICU|nr:GPI transamidase component PIG-S [Psilocybe cubensis]KAH9478672.1 GPI transamidase component PIG-S [Psilocybe cubensis]
MTQPHINSVPNISIVLAYCAVIILALPAWWYTTSIQRLSLPSSRVHQLAQSHLQLPISLCIETSDVELTNSVRKTLSTQISRELERWKGLLVNVEGKVACAGESDKSDVYTIIPTSGPSWIQGRRLYTPLNGPSYIIQLAHTITSLLAPYSASNDPEHRVAQYSPRYRLAFSLLNEDAAAGNAILDWKIQDGLKANVNPILHRLSPLHNFTIESQVQFHAPLAFTPRQLDQAHGLTPEDLTVFVNSADWTLSSSSSNDPVLHFILFIPSVAHRPLRLLRNDGSASASTAFLVPQWGGIIIHNPKLGSFSGEELPQQDLNDVFYVFTNQLLALLGVPSLPPNVAKRTSGLSDWQLDALVRRRVLENAQGSQDTLLSIVKLVDQIENMPVGEDVKGDVEDALDALTKMYETSTTSLYQAFSHSAESFVLASRAFFNPGMLALLYFPAEHKYGVYAPLFASALIPLLVAALRELSAYRQERRTDKEAATKTIRQ